jgi:hypothetical protein
MTPSYHLIGLTGLAGSGKDTVRDMLQREHGFAGMAFAEPIRSMLRELLTSTGIDPAWMDSRELKEKPITGLEVSYRQMAQTLGTEWGRSLQPDFWLRIADGFLASVAAQGETHFVISDVRFQNEADWVRERGGVIWRIEREGIEPVRAHASEAEINQLQVDAVIPNHGSLEELENAVWQALEAFV